jgi:prephenate dehydratase
MVARIGFEGIAGSHSEEAVLQLFKSQPGFKGQATQPTGYNSFDQVFKAVLNGDVEYGLVPIENSIAGSFFPVVDLIISNNLHVVGEFEQEERQVLAGLSGSELEDIKEVHSHPYAFDQCRPFLGTLGDKKLVQSLDTAWSCQQIQQHKLTGIAAIASKKAAALYGLYVIYEIETSAVTRYALVSKSPVVPERHLNPRTSIQVVLKNQVGAMMKAISAFSLRDIRYRSPTITF